MVVGCGCAGWAASHEAINAGAKVIIIEKNPFIGGDMSVNAGILPGYETEYTKAAGVSATADELWQEYLDRGENPHGVPPQDVIEYVFRNCSENIDFLANAGVEWERLPPQPNYSSYDVFFEAHYGDKAGGASFVEPMQKSIESNGAELLMETRGKRLIANDAGRVIGIETAQVDGSSLFLKANRGVILTTGGYTGNSKMIAVFAEQWHGISSCAIKSNIGDGLMMATQLGAITVRTEDGGFFLANSQYDTGANVNADCLYTGFICDQSGKRCINDGASYATNDFMDEFKKQFGRQSEDYLWLVIDSSPDSIAPYENNNKVFGTSFITADTLDDLAEQMGVDATALVQTAADFSSKAGLLTDPEFGERTSGMPIHVVEVGPFHALRISPYIVMTTGGLKANLDGRVLRMKLTGTEDDVAPGGNSEILEPVEGLFAAGQLVEWSCFTGWSCTSCFTLGRLAGKTAASEQPAE